MGLCCAVFETASCACSLGKCLLKDGKMSTKCANVVYLSILFIMTFISFILRQWGAPQFNFYSFNIGCTDIPNIDPSACKGENAVYRISVGLAIWFVIIAIGNICCKRFHTGLWGIKIISLLVIVCGLFFIPLVGQQGYVQAARVISSIFLVSQIISFIDAAYHWNAFFVDKSFGENGEDKRWMTAALTLCFLILLATVICIILLYVFYNDCERQTIFITVTSILIIFSTLLQLNTEDTDSSLITSCIVAAYAVYLCWSAVTSDECNVNNQTTDNQLILGCLVTACSLAWTCHSAGTKDWEKENKLEYEDIQEEEESLEEESLEETSEEDKSMILFHIIMATGSIYMSMLLTNWGTMSGYRSDAQMWVSIASQWVSILLYIWTLIAPKCCPSRDFNR